MTTKYAIEKNVPRPQDSHHFKKGAPSPYPILAMAVGDSFLVRFEDYAVEYAQGKRTFELVVALQKKLYSHAKNVATAAGHPDWKWSVRQVPEGCRVWRTA